MFLVPWRSDRGCVVPDQPQRVLKPDLIRRECEASLRRLGVDHIDLYQFHWPDETGTRIEDSWAAIAKLIEEGKVRAAGVSNFDVSLLDRCEAIRHVEPERLRAPDEPHDAGTGDARFPLKGDVW